MGRLSRFQDAKFGLFVHWGAYSVAGVEASWPVMLGAELQGRFSEALRRLGIVESAVAPRTIGQEEYEALPRRFDPVRFDAQEWVDLVRDAGQRYVVLTTKHHDGFAMYDTATSGYSITNTPFGRDVTAELATACTDGGVGFGAYFSAPDICQPGYRDLRRPLHETFLGQPERPEWGGFLDVMEAQVRELCTSYGELFSLWWDVGFGPQWPVERFHRVVRELQPDCLLNDRLGGLAPDVPDELAADFLTPEQTVPRSIPRRSTLGTPMDPTMLFALIQRDDWEEALEQVAPVVRAHLDAPADPSLPGPKDFLPWESCLTFGGQWAWSPDIQDFKSGDDIIRDLVEVASRGGNLLLNVGPRPDGTIQPEFQTALRAVGRWLERNGAGIHGTTFGPVQGRDGVRTTATDTHVYVHLLEPPTDGRMHLPLIGVRDEGWVLGADAPVDVWPENRGDGRDGITIELGRVPWEDPVTTLALERSD